MLSALGCERTGDAWRRLGVVTLVIARLDVCCPNVGNSERIGDCHDGGDFHTGFGNCDFRADAFVGNCKLGADASVVGKLSIDNCEFGADTSIGNCNIGADTSIGNSNFGADTSIVNCNSGADTSVAGILPENVALVLNHLVSALC